MELHTSQHIALKVCLDPWVGNKVSTTHGYPRSPRIPRVLKNRLNGCPVTQWYPDFLGFIYKKVDTEPSYKKVNFPNLDLKNNGRATALGRTLVQIPTPRTFCPLFPVLLLSKFIPADPDPEPGWGQDPGGAEEEPTFNMCLQCVLLVFPTGKSHRDWHSALRRWRSPWPQYLKISQKHGDGIQTKAHNLLPHQEEGTLSKGQGRWRTHGKHSFCCNRCDLQIVEPLSVPILETWWVDCYRKICPSQPVTSLFHSSSLWVVRPRASPTRCPN